MRILTWKRGQGLHMLPMLQQKAGGSVERRLTEINFNKLTWQLEPGAGDDLDMNNFQCSSKVESRGLEIAWYSHEAKLPSSTRSGSWNARRGSGNVPVTFCITRLGICVRGVTATAWCVGQVRRPGRSPLACACSLQQPRRKVLQRFPSAHL